MADVIFNPPETHLIRQAIQHSCEVVDGMEMLVGQGVIAVEHWTDRTPDAEVMRDALAAVFRDS